MSMTPATIAPHSRDPALPGRTCPGPDHGVSLAAGNMILKKWRNAKIIKTN